MGKDAAEAVLSRFSVPMGLAVSQVLRDRGLEADSNLRDELDQKARILAVTYAGLMPGWHSGKLADWTAESRGDEAQIRLLVTHGLKLDLAQLLGRQLRRDSRTISLDAMTENGIEPADNDWENRMIEHIDNRSDIARYRDLYPTLARNVFDGMTQTEIAEDEETPLRTIQRRIAKEKREFLMAFVRSRGLCVEGDETLEELTEAYLNLTAGTSGASPESLPVAA